MLASAFLPEALTGMELCSVSCAPKQDAWCFSVDEYGMVQGIMTPRDLREAITGEPRSVEDARAWATRREDGSRLI